MKPGVWILRPSLDLPGIEAQLETGQLGFHMGSGRAVGVSPGVLAGRLGFLGLGGAVAVSPRPFVGP